MARITCKKESCGYAAPPPRRREQEAWCPWERGHPEWRRPHAGPHHTRAFGGGTMRGFKPSIAPGSVSKSIERDPER